MRNGEFKPRPICELLARYSNLKAPEGAVLSVVLRVVEEVVGINLARKDVRYTVASRIVSLQFAGPKKQEIILRKAEILKRCKVELGERSAPKGLV